MGFTAPPGTGGQPAIIPADADCDAREIGQYNRNREMLSRVYQVGTD
jgi:hypothetical protein